MPVTLCRFTNISFWNFWSEVDLRRYTTAAKSRPGERIPLAAQRNFARAIRQDKYGRDDGTRSRDQTEPIPSSLIYRLGVNVFPRGARIDGMETCHGHGSHLWGLVHFRAQRTASKSGHRFDHRYNNRMV